MGEQTWLNPEEESPREARAAPQHPWESCAVQPQSWLSQSVCSPLATKSYKSHHQEGRRVHREGATGEEMGSASSHRAQTLAAVTRVTAVHPSPCWELDPAFPTPIVHLPVSHSSLQCTFSISLSTMGCHRLLHTLSKQHMQIPPLGECSAPTAWRECREHTKTWESHSR